MDSWEKIITGNFEGAVPIARIKKKWNSPPVWTMMTPPQNKGVSDYIHVSIDSARHNATGQPNEISIGRQASGSQTALRPKDSNSGEFHMNYGWGDGQPVLITSRDGKISIEKKERVDEFRRNFGKVSNSLVLLPFKEGRISRRREEKHFERFMEQMRGHF